MKTFSLPRQFVLLLLILAGVSVVIAAFSYVQLLSTVREASERTENTLVQLGRSYSLLERSSELQGELQRLLRLKDPDDMEKSIQIIEAVQKQVRELIAAGGPSSAPIQAAYEKLSLADKEVKDLFLLGEVSPAIERFFAVLVPQYELLLVELRKNHQMIAKETRIQWEQAAAELHGRLVWRFSVAGGLIVLMSLAALRIERRLSRRLLELTGRLAGTSQQLDDSSRQVSAASSQLAKTAGEQAAALEETSASLEEMASMTKQNAGHSRQAKDLADEARLASDACTTDMREMNQAMLDIEGSSKGIAKIIQTIDEIAFQTCPQRCGGSRARRRSGFGILRSGGRSAKFGATERSSSEGKRR